MPSKAKKHSKTPTTPSSSSSRLSNYESARTPSSSSRALDTEPAEMDFMCSLEEASNKYPSLIGTSAFIGQLTSVDDALDHASKGFKIWLSEPSMVASSFTPGSVVSVICYFPLLIYNFFCFRNFPISLFNVSHKF